MRWTFAATGVVIGAVGAALLVARFASGDSIFIVNPLVVGALVIGLAAAAWTALRSSAGAAAPASLAVSIGALLLVAALSVITHAAFPAARMSALRMPLMAATRKSYSSMDERAFNSASTA